MTSAHKRIAALLYNRIPDPATQPPGDARHVMLSLHFNTDNPFEVTLTVGERLPFQRPTIRSAPAWRFDRTLLKAVTMVPGGSTPELFGRGDVVVGTVGNGSLCFQLVAGRDAAGRLGSNASQAWVACRTDPVREFVVAIDALCPPGTESYDVDDWLTHLLPGGYSGRGQE